MSLKEKVSSGLSVLDVELDGGLGVSDILQIYGPGGVGKTTLALQFCINAARTGHRILYVNLEGQFPIIRLRQMAESDFDEVSPLISVVSPTSFKEQSELVSRLESIISTDVRLIVFDTIVSLYRTEYGLNSEILILNRKLNQQFGILASLSRSFPFSIIVVNQVRGDVEGDDFFQPVASSVVSYWSTYSVQITKAESKGYREFKLFKGEESEPSTFVVELHSTGFR
ncbi:MAG: ATPase domain-containing protein [Candidatus Thorarchaeota archaeon]